MFFLLFGTRPTLTLLVVVRFVCPICGVDAPQHVYQQANKFTLFFVPLFTFSKHHYNQCTNCGGTTDLTAQQVDHALAWSASHSNNSTTPYPGR